LFNSPIRALPINPVISVTRIVSPSESFMGLDN
jgi:hypothetical protein